MCPFCGASVSDLAAHYAGDDCLPLVIAFGALTPEGKQRELDTHYRLNEMEAAAREAKHTGNRQPRVLGKIQPRKRYGFVKAATECRECSAPVFKHGRCEAHYTEHVRMMARRYYYDNRERCVRQKREQRQAGMGGD